MGQLGFFFAGEAAPPRREAAKSAPKRDETNETFHPSIQAQVHLERALRTLLGPRVIVKLTTNRSTMISFRRRGSALYVRVHSMFGGAPADVLEALAAFISEDEIPMKQSALLDHFIETHRDQLNRTRVHSLRLQPYGEVHNLREIFEELNGAYFERKVEARITWSSAARKKRRTSMNMGTYSDELRLIRIHPALDQEWVPRFFVASVVHHEMLHQLHDVKSAGGRRCIHTAEFRADEARFAQFAEAQSWERRHLTKLLKY
jgi:hypothetical protein